MPDLTCLACPGPGVEQHHHPRRSAGTEFVVNGVNMVIPLDDPRRLVPVCRQLHIAIGEHRIILEHYIGGLLFTLDGVVEAKNLPDADYLIYQEQVVWQRLAPPDNIEDAMGQILHATDLTAETWEPLIKYMGPAELIPAYQHFYGMTAKLRQLHTHQTMLTTFGWRRDGKPCTRTDRVKAIATSFGVSERTIWRDLGEDTDNVSAKCPSDLSPDGKHTRVCAKCGASERKCQHCGAK